MRNKSILRNNFETIQGFSIDHVVYTLAHPITKDVFYVGVTQRDLSVRLKYHIKSALSEPGSWVKRDFIKNILNFGLTPIIEPVETVVSKSYEDYLNLPKIEAFWINQFRSWGFYLINSQGNSRRSMKSNC